MTENPVSPIDEGRETEATVSQIAERLNSAWGLELEAVVCEGCDWSYLLPKGNLPQRCPHCFQANLTPITEKVEGLPYTQPPELVVPFALSASRLVASIQNFTQGIPFASSDLNAKSLQSRMRRLYLPRWLVDAEVKATWQAEMGFDYEVVSHQDQYQEGRGGWSSRQVNERRVRWEPRLGRLARSYQNIAAPALEEDRRLQEAVGPYNVDEAQAYRSEELGSSFVRLPNRTPQDAWPDAKPAFQAAAAEECRQAAGADHQRNFNWQPDYQSQNWTLLLLPLYITYYQDDEGKAQPVLVQAQTGKMYGVRRASLKRAQRTSITLLTVASVAFLVSLLLSAVGMVVPLVLAMGVIGMVVALLIALGALFPITTVWWFNREERPS
jgi:hypothetical protein